MSARRQSVLKSAKIILWFFIFVNSASLLYAKRGKRVVIPKSLLILDARGIPLILDAVKLVRDTNIFRKDNLILTRIALVEGVHGHQNTHGGLWNLDECSFRDVTQNRREYGKKLSALLKNIRRAFGLQWQWVGYRELRRPLYSVLATSIYLEMIAPSIPKSLKSQASLWARKYHSCKDREPDSSELRRREDTFIKVVKRSCESGYLNCAHSCEKLDNGRVTCACRDGYTLMRDGLSCAANTSDACDSQDKKCDQACVHTNQEFRCTCHRGFLLQEDGITCEDVDECVSSPCQHFCENSPGGYQCSCKKGFNLMGDGSTCQDIHAAQGDDDCQINSLDCTRKCQEIAGIPGCVCPPGMKLGEDNSTCLEVDECSQFNGLCHHECINTPQGHRCVCSPGYQLNENGITCMDMDECSSNQHKCQHSCLNVPGGHYCTCPRGFRLNEDQRTCSDIDECLVYPGTCRSPSRCRNTIGGYKCGCPKGFKRDRVHVCVDVDECSFDNGGCSQLCLNVKGSYRCACQYGYRLQSDRKTCKDVDECTRFPGLCHHHCVNTPGSYKCVCPPGKREYLNGLICL